MQLQFDTQNGCPGVDFRYNWAANENCFLTDSSAVRHQQNGALSTVTNADDTITLSNDFGTLKITNGTTSVFFKQLQNKVKLLLEFSNLNESVNHKIGHGKQDHQTMPKYHQIAKENSVPK